MCTDGFRKITHIENSGLKVETDEIEFYHSCFVKGQENMLEYIKRKNSLSVTHAKSNGALEDKTNKEEVHLILTDVKGIKDKQDSMDSMLVSLQNENEALWKEISTLRHKHQKQQQIVERLIHFLMSLVQAGNFGLKRKTPLMIDNKNGNRNLNLSTMASNLLNSNANSGPIIQEITHGLLDDDEYDDSNMDSPIVNAAQSDTSEPAQQFDDINDSPTFLNAPTNQQTSETAEPKDSTSGGQLVSTSQDLFDPLQESINAINADDDQIIDLNAVDAIPVGSPIVQTPTSQIVHDYQLQSPQQQQTNLVSDQLPNITTTTASNIVDNSNQLKLVLPTTTTTPITYSSLVPSTSNVLNTPSITL